MSADRKIIALQSHPIWLPQTQTWLYEQVRRLPNELVESHIVCEKTENLDQFAVPNIHSLNREPSIRRWIEYVARRLRIRNHLEFLVAVGKNTGAHLVHSHFGHLGWFDLRAVQKLGVRHIATFYGLDVNQLPNMGGAWRSRYQDLFASVDRILCEGPHMASCVVGLGCPPKKVQVHHLGVSVEEIPYRPRYWNSTQPLRILIAATFREKKGIPYAISAVSAVKDDVQLELTIIGDVSAEPGSQGEKEKILSLLDRSGLRSRTRLLGFRPYHELMTEAYNHHFFLSPSVTASDGDTEGGAPVTIIELAASGMPIISTRHCDIPNVLPKNALLAEERDVDGLVEILRRWINTAGNWEPALLQARRHIELNSNAATQGRKLAAIYAEVAGFYMEDTRRNLHAECSNPS